MRVAAVQLNSTDDSAGNVARAADLVAAAAEAGAGLIALPEKWNLLAGGAALRAGAEPIDGPSITAARGWASEFGVHLLAGSIAELVVGEPRLFNTSVLIGPGGEIVATYRKIHLFDVEVGGVTYRESEAEQPGGEIVVTRLGDSGIELGLSV